MLCGSLPFDDEISEKEIARQTIHDPVPFYPNLWKKLSKEARDFVENLLDKDASKRMSIKECCDHPWIQKFHQSNIADIRKANKDNKVSTFKMYSTTEENEEN
jgi:serine/threonine protein kinase